MRAVGSVLTAALAWLVLASAAPAADLPLKIAPGGRYLVDRNGGPFLVVGDTAWSLIVQLDSDDIDRYLDDRQKRAFNSIIVNLIEHQFCADPPRTRAGLAPFNAPGDFSTPNSRYFDFAHEVVRKANDRGIVVWLFPAYLGYGGGEQGFFRAMKASGRESLREYGRFVARRFADLPNIVWVMGGDFTPPPGDQWVVGEMVAGIRAEDPSRLITGHGVPGDSAVAAFGAQDWLAVNSVYSYDKALFRPIGGEFERRPVRPFVLIESTYEGEHQATPDQIRRQAYWAMLGGACGQFFGNNPIWHFDGPGLFPVKTTWQESLDGTASRDMARLAALFSTLPWHQLEPETDHEIVSDGFGSDLATALTARTADRRLSVTYIPSTGVAPRRLAVELGWFTGPVTARWYNPADGSWIAIGDDALAPRGSPWFATPGDNGTAAGDWLLVLEAH
jgi:hypothetical protein